MTSTIGVVQVKGGVGRSTIATNLAGSLPGAVALVDCDMPQGTSASWAAIREQQGKTGTLTIKTAGNHVELVKLVEILSSSHEYVVLDCPPRIAEMTKAALILSDLCLVPLGASAAEVWATSDLLTTIKAASQVKPTVDARIVWNRYRASTSSAQELSAAVSDGLGLAEMKNKLGLRVAYSDAFARGMTVLEWNDKAARDEMTKLVDEIATILSHGGK